MATYTDRGSGTPATTGTTWATATNAVDGTPPANPATYATMTSTTASAVATIEISGYDFGTVIAAVDTLTSISVTLRHFENTVARFTSVAVTVWDGATQIGGSNNCTLATAARDDAFTYTPTLAQLRSATFKVRVTITGAASTQSRVESIDHVDVAATYTPLAPAITQASYRFYADGTESGSTALANQDTAYTANMDAGDVNLLLRTRLQSTNAAPPAATDDFQLQVETNASGTWNDVTPAADGYTVSGNTSNVGFTAGFLRIGQSFTGNGQKLLQAAFKFYRTGTLTNNWTAKVYAHSGTFGTSSLPTGSPLATSTAKAGSSIDTSPSTWVYFDFDGTYLLANGTKYVVTLECDISNAGGALVVDYKSPGTHPGIRSMYDTVWNVSLGDVDFQLVTTSVSAISFDSANLTDDAATTNRLGAGTGSFVAGKISEDGLVDDLGWTANNYTELLYTVTLKAAALANGDTLRFRVLRNGAITGLTYTQTPTVSVTKTTAAGGKIKVWTGSAWVEKPVKVWSGSAWVEKPVKVWSGSSWVLS